VNRREAFRHYRAAVDAKDVRALEGLGRCYAYGIGTNFDFDKAAKYLSAAKDAGSATADGELLRIYENKKRHMLRSLYSTTMRVYYQGKFTEAKELIKTCISLGIAEAVYCVGCMYEFGITLPPNRELAMKYYKSAAEMGYKDDRGAHKQWLLRISKKYKI
jgi:TPR repeat protein